jgi:hypothetical protein
LIVLISFAEASFGLGLRQFQVENAKWLALFAVGRESWAALEWLT